MGHMKGCVYAIALAGVMILAQNGCGRQQPGPPAALPLAEVEVYTVQPQQFVQRITAVGTILSKESVTIKPEVAGKITKIFFSEGAHIKAGAPLFELDSELLEAELQEVKADLDFARAQYARAQNLKKSSIMPDNQYDEVYRSYITAQAKVNNLATRIRKHSLTAPFSGILGRRQVSMGDYVSVGAELVTLEDISSVKAEFYVPERYLPYVHAGQNVDIRVDALQEKRSGTVYIVDPRIDPDTRSVILRATIENADESLKPGMFCTVRLEIMVKPDAVVIPRTAIITRGERQIVFVNKGGIAQRRKITTGASDGERVEVVAGLSPGDHVVVVGAQKIGQGWKIKER